MKLPRWLVIAMLTTSVLAVLGYAGWWWVKWPERTARQFVDMVTRKSNYQELVDNFGGKECYTMHHAYQSMVPGIIADGIAVGIERGQRQFSPKQRSARDILVGRQEFSYGEEGHEGCMTFQRGKLVRLWLTPY
jgi:hypothetical protein